jgi:Raf kinase inhibitor-like YbhB/YbcL family protein
LSIRLSRLGALAGACLIVLAACSNDGRSLREPGTGGATPRPTPEPTTTVDLFVDADPDAFTLRSPSVAPSEMLPLRHAYGGSNVPPELRWRNVPEGTVELALVVTDVTANDFVHWVMAGIDPQGGTTLYEALVPPGAVQALNDFGELGWGGPAPPVGDEAHSYVFKLLALGELSGLEGGEVGASVIPMLESKAIGVAELVVFYRQAAALDP